MEPNIFKININETEYQFRIVPLLKSDKNWSFQIEDLPPASRFSIELNDDKGWIQTSGKDKIDEIIIVEIGKVVRKQYL